MGGVRLGVAVDLLPRALSVTTSGEIFIAGHTQGPAGERAALVKLGTTGTEQWRQEFDFLSADARLSGVAVTASGGVVVTGSVHRLIPVNGQPHPTQQLYVAAFGPQGGAPLWERESHPSALSSGADVFVQGSQAWVTGVYGEATPATQLFVAKYQL